MEEWEDIHSIFIDGILPWRNAISLQTVSDTTVACEMTIDVLNATCLPPPPSPDIYPISPMRGDCYTTTA